MSHSEDLWRRRSDEELVDASQRLDDYTDEGREIIRAELLRRALPVPEGWPVPAPVTAAEAPQPQEQLASLGERAIGQILDSMVALVVICVSAVPAAFSPELGATTLVAGLIVALAYILFSDALSNGQSYGKRFTKTAVVHATTGAPCTFGQSFVRNFLLSLLGVLDWVFIFFGTRRQRLGDRAAHTIVIKAAA